MSIHREASNEQTDIVRRVALKVTLLDVNDTVKELRQVKAQTFAGFFVVGTNRRTVGEPLAVGEGVF